MICRAATVDADADRHPGQTRLRNPCLLADVHDDRLVKIETRQPTPQLMCHAGTEVPLANTAVRQSEHSKSGNNARLVPGPT